MSITQCSPGHVRVVVEGKVTARHVHFQFSMHSSVSRSRQHFALVQPLLPRANMDVMNEKFDPLESFDLPDFHITQANCKAKVIAYGKAKGLQMKWKNGRCDQTGVCIYSYCTSHAECGFKYKHDFVSQEGSNIVTHIVSCKGSHSAAGRQVRGTDVVLRAKADEMTKSHTAMGAYAEMVKDGQEIELAPSRDCLQRARRRQKRVQQEQVQVPSHPSLVDWLHHLENLESGKWDVRFGASGLCVLVHEKYGSVIGLHSLYFFVFSCCIFFYSVLLFVHLHKLGSGTSCAAAWR